MALECIQLYDDQQTPCFKALGVCGLSMCPVNTYLKEQSIDPIHPDYYGAMIRHYALHWICVQSIHNDNLTEEQRVLLKQGLIQQLK